MTPETYRRAAEMFLQLCDQPESARSEWLEGHCDDPELLVLVRQLAEKDELIGQPKSQLDESSDGNRDASESSRQNLAAEQPTPSELGSSADTIESTIKLDSFGDYTDLTEIGRGGLGVIYRARQISLNRIVALKMIRSSDQVPASTLLRFRLEAEAAAKLDHPNIVPIYEIGVSDDRQFFSMKLIEGGNLAQWLRGQSRGIRDKVDILIKSAEAIHYAHQKGVLHRDIKPANILVDLADQPHVTDFGLAKHLEMELDLTMTGQIIGTPSYMSPEQAAGNNAKTTIATDVYGLGTVLYECLTGQPPFDSTSMYETVRLVVETDPARPSIVNPSVDRDLETICLRCLKKDPGARYGSALDIAHELGRWSRGEPIQARPVSLVERSIKWTRRKPAIAILMLSILVVVAIAVGLRTQYERSKHLEQAERAVSAVLNAEPARINSVMNDVDDVRGIVVEKLRVLYQRAEDGTTEKLNLSLALLQSDPSDPSHRHYLTRQLSSVPPDQFLVLLEALRDDEAVCDELWEIVADNDTVIDEKFQALEALASYVPDDSRLETDTPFILNHLIDRVPLSRLRTVAARFPFLHHELAQRAKRIIDQQSAVSSRKLERAANLLAECLTDQPEQLAEFLFVIVDPAVFDVMVEALRPNATEVVPWLIEVLGKDSSGDESSGETLRRKAIAAAAAIKMDSTDLVWPLLKHSSDPSLRSALIKAIAQLAPDPLVLASRLGLEPDVTARRALIGVIGELDSNRLATSQRVQIVDQLTTAYLTDRDPGCTRYRCTRWSNGKRPCPQLLPAGRSCHPRVRRNSSKSTRKSKVWKSKLIA